jgi:hypothetical protein
MSTRNIPWGGNSSCCAGLTTLPPLCADCLEIWEPRPPGTLRACKGIAFGHVVAQLVEALHYKPEGRGFKVKGESCFTGLFNTSTTWGYCILTPTSSCIHLQRRHASYRCARPLPAKAGTIPPNFASRSVIYKNPLGSFTCCKAGTWDILFYFLSEGRHTEDFLDA